MTQQSKLGSLIEASANTAIGFGVAVASQIVLFPLVDVHVPLATNFELGAYFTVISIVRGYALRRWFNARLHRAVFRLVNH